MNWIAWSREVERDRAVLERILVLLLSLAGLAERASSRSRPVRALLLGLLRPGEVAARAFVTGLADDLGAPIALRRSRMTVPIAAMAVQEGDLEAAHLARSYYMLALRLDYMLAQAHRLFRVAERFAVLAAPPRAASQAAWRMRWHGLALGREPLRVPAPDTS